MVLGVVLLFTVAGCSKSQADQALDELNAGLASNAAGKTAEAAAHWKTCLTHEPANKFCLFNLGVVAGSVAEGENYYRLALAQDGNFISALLNLGILLQNSGRPADAIPLYRHLLKLDPTVAAAHFDLGLALVATGDVEGGKLELAEGHRLDPKLVIPNPLPVPGASGAPSATAKPGASAAPEPTAAPAPSAQPTAAANRTYTVQEGDRLSTIAAQFNTTVEALQTLNNLASGAVLTVGQVLKLP